MVEFQGRTVCGRREPVCVCDCVCEAAVQRIRVTGTSHSNAASDRPSVGRQHLQQDDQHDETPEQADPTTHGHRRGSLSRTSVLLLLDILAFCLSGLLFRGYFILQVGFGRPVDNL